MGKQRIQGCMSRIKRLDYEIEVLNADIDSLKSKILIVEKRRLIEQTYKESLIDIEVD